MTEETRKKLAPTVVLASHGNKTACRDLYIHYYKNIFFICTGMTGDIRTASALTAQSFIKMFASLDKLKDHNAFESWFYSLTVNICRSHSPEANGGIIDDDIRKSAAAAAQQAKNRDMAAFERSVVKILERMLLCLPATARVIFFYRYFALLDSQQIALLEKTEQDTAENSIKAVDLLIERQCEKIRALGVDLSMFTKDMTETLEHIAAKKFVPDNIHNEVSESLGIDVNPFAAEKKQKKEEPKTPVTNNETEKNRDDEKHKFRLTKGDFILFFSVIAVVLIICSVAGFFFSSREDTAQTTASQSDGEKPALLWNGAAASAFDGGSGTQEDPFQIATGGQLAYLANLVNDGNSYYAACHYILTADIILNETVDFGTWDTNPPENKWTPIGSSADDDSHAYFTGSFDGNGCTISGMYITGGNDYSGLFGITRNASFTDITVTDSFVSGGSYTGGIAGYFAADTNEQSGFTSCSFSGRVHSDGNNAGGITGYFRAEGDSNTTAVSECCVSGLITVSNGYAGGIAGASEADTGSVMIKNCFNTATINAKKNAGGITGDSRAADGVAIIDCCYNAGDITASENAGGISGIINCADGEGKVNIQSCFMLDTSSPVGLTRGDGGERLIVGSISIFSSSEMLLGDNFEPFNFEDVWEMPDSGDYSYPVLADTDFHYNLILPDESSTV